MDNAQFSTLYSTAVCKFTDAASLVSKQEILGTWPVNYKVSRIMLLYIFTLAQVNANTVTLTDNQILSIAARMNKLKYEQ